MTDREYVDFYLYKISPTERRYYDSWAKWHRFKILPWDFLNKKRVTRDMILALEQLDSMFNERLRIKEHKDQIAKDQMQFRPFQQQQQRSNKTQSVL